MLHAQSALTSLSASSLLGSSLSDVHDLAPSASTSAAARRAPIGKVIHYFTDTQSHDHPQGYDGMKFQEYYQELVLKPTVDGDAAAATPSGSGKAKATSEDDEDKVTGDVADETVDEMVSG